MNKKFTILAIISILIFCFAITPITLQNDTFYTIKIGEYILNNGINMEQDPFSMHEIPYTYPHWLYDVGIYLIYSVGGMAGIYISTVILACILGITVYITNKEITKNELVSFILTLGVMYVLTGFIAARAQLVTFILFALSIYFIEKFLETKKKRYWVALIIIPIIIANVHLAVWPFYFIIFMPYIAEYLIYLIADLHLFYKIQTKYYNIKMKKMQEKQKSEEKIKQVQEKIDILNKKFEENLKKQERRRQEPYKIKMEKRDNTKWLIVIM